MESNVTTPVDNGEGTEKSLVKKKPFTRRDELIKEMSDDIKKKLKENTDGKTA